MSTEANIKNKYLQLLDKFKNSDLQTQEGEHMKALALLVDAYEDEEYIHMPVSRERGKRAPLDNAFSTIQANHQAIEAALAQLVDDVNSLEDELTFDEGLLNGLLEVLRTEVTMRALNTAGQEQYERQVTESFTWPLTLAPENSTDKTSAASSVEWEPNDPNSLTWIGDLTSDATDPVRQPLSALLYGEIINVQVVAWSLDVDISDALINSLTDILSTLTTVQPLDPSDFFIISGVGVDSNPTNDPDGSGVLKVKLSVPELISHIELSTVPQDVIDHVLIINHQGVPTMYEMIGTHVFIRPTVVSEIHFHITGGNTGLPLDAAFLTQVDYEETEGGSQHVTGYFTDRVSANVLEQPAELTSPRSDGAPNTNARASATNKEAVKRAAATNTGLQANKARDLLSTSSLTAKDKRVQPGTKSTTKPLSETKASRGPAAVGAEGQDIRTRPTVKVAENTEASTKLSSSKTSKKSTPRADRDIRPRATTPASAKPTSTPPGKSNRGEQDITTDNDTPSSTKTNAGSREPE